MDSSTKLLNIAANRNIYKSLAESFKYYIKMDRNTNCYLERSQGELDQLLTDVQERYPDADSKGKRELTAQLSGAILGSRVDIHADGTRHPHYLNLRIKRNHNDLYFECRTADGTSTIIPLSRVDRLERRNYTSDNNAQISSAP